ncbi:hypothetical protein Ga0466249_004973 [Sporomusaceae bacterium BoRhaA]|nr:hypothetical protein [Pelorhabdus rhamnosifermentans]
MKNALLGDSIRLVNGAGGAFTSIDFDRKRNLVKIFRSLLERLAVVERCELRLQGFFLGSLFCQWYHAGLVNGVGISPCSTYIVMT